MHKTHSTGLNIGAIILFCSALLGCDLQSTANQLKEEQPADLIFSGDNIITMDGQAEFPEAVAIRNGTIISVGERNHIMAFAGKNTRIVELGEHALVPGFIDAHGHLGFLSVLTEMANLSPPPIGNATSIADIVDIIKKHIDDKKIPPGAWVLGFGYDDSLMKENRHPTRDDLDLASTEHPIAIMHASGHLAAVNSRALAERNVTADTQDPKGGLIRRYPGSSEPDGVLEELAAFDFTLRKVNEMKREKLEIFVQQGIKLYASHGVTTIQEGGADAEEIIALRNAAKASPFAPDVVAYQMIDKEEVEIPTTLKPDSTYVNGFRVGGAKIFLDGSPQGRTAYMTSHYHSTPAGTDQNYVAYPTRSAEIYNKQISAMIAQGIPTIVHANGDAAIDMMIAGVRKAVSGKAQPPDHRTVIIHAQLMRQDQVDQAADLGMVASFFSAHTYFWGDWHRISFGEERAANISPTGWAKARGLPFTVHNDTPVVPPDMMRLMWASVNRTTRSGHVLGSHQRITPYEALHGITLGAAYQYFEESSKGSITPGKQADLVILSSNPLTTPPDTIKDIAIIETIAKGKTLYRLEDKLAIQ